MAKIKHTKNEMKAQKEALRRYERFLPMLQLKKLQLQVEIQSIDAKLAANRNEDGAIRREMDPWIRLFSEQAGIENSIEVESLITGEGNIAGVSIPVLTELKLRKTEPDLFLTPSWFDDAMEALEKLMRLNAERRVLEKQRECIVEELRTTAQRVNLFEKVKIPECSENIRVIKIFLGDQQTAAVVRGKIAKKRTEKPEEAAA